MVSCFLLRTFKAFPYVERKKEIGAVSDETAPFSLKYKRISSERCSSALPS